MGGVDVEARAFRVQELITLAATRKTLSARFKSAITVGRKLACDMVVDASCTCTTRRIDLCTRSWGNFANKADACTLPNTGGSARSGLARTDLRTEPAPATNADRPPP